MFIKNFFEEIMVENYPNLEERHILTGLRNTLNPNRINPMKSMPRPIIIKLLKTTDKENFMKIAREK